VTGSGSRIATHHVYELVSFIRCFTAAMANYQIRLPDIELRARRGMSSQHFCEKLPGRGKQAANDEGRKVHVEIRRMFASCGTAPYMVNDDFHEGVSQCEKRTRF